MLIFGWTFNKNLLVLLFSNVSVNIYVSCSELYWTGCDELHFKECRYQISTKSIDEMTVFFLPKSIFMESVTRQMSNYCAYRNKIFEQTHSSTIFKRHTSNGDNSVLISNSSKCLNNVTIFRHNFSNFSCHIHTRFILFVKTYFLTPPEEGAMKLNNFSECWRY
jgi:hypothetical protein